MVDPRHGVGRGLSDWTEDQDFFGAGVPTWTTDRVEIYLRPLD